MSGAAEGSRPNIVFAFADDWGRHAGAYGTPVLRTPTFDRIAREGALFNRAFVAAPSCTPSRNAVLTGQWHWRLKQGVNLWSSFPGGVPVITDILEEAGYHAGHYRKAWGPGKLQYGERKENPAGKGYKNPDAFLEARGEGQPFFFWFGSSDPHRPYKEGSGAESGMDLSQIELPRFLPDDPVVRGDLADYFWEVQRFDREVGDLLRKLEEMGELENTLVVMSGDHGMPFPRCKSNLYDSGCAVPLAVRWPGTVKGGRTVDDFVSLPDLAPTFLEAAGAPVPEVMTARSMMALLGSEASGQADPARDHVIAGKERHVPSQPEPSTGGYPSRMIRTSDFLYILNLDPGRWPNGVLDPRETILGRQLADCDDGPAKAFLIRHRDDDPEVQRCYDLAFAKRPEEELYHVASDPDQLANVAADPAYADIKASLRQRLEAALRATADPRFTDPEEAARIDKYPYLGANESHPIWEHFIMPPR